MIPIEVLIGGGAAAVAVTVFVASRVLERRRRETYREYCLTRGFAFERRWPGAEERIGAALDVFKSGRSRRWGYTIRGTRNRAPFTAFEYRWVTGGGTSSHTHHLHGMLWESEDGRLPRFALTPESWLTRWGEVFGMQDIDFPESPEFSRAYRLRGEDEAAIRGLFAPEVRAFFAATAGQHVAGAGRYLFWWHPGRLPKVERLDEWLDEGDRVRRRLLPVGG